MGTMPVTKLLLNMSLPMMFSMFVQSLYNIVDSIFVSMISENALTAVSLAFPVQNIMIAVAVGTSVGINALVSMRLGQKDQEQVNKGAMNGIFLSCCNFVFFLIVGLTCMHAYMASQTRIQEIIDYGVTYLTIVVSASFGLFGVITFDRLLQSTGKTIYTMISQIAGALFNCIFDPLLIFGIGPFPKMGMAGAAWATVFGQILSMSISLFFNLRINHEIQFHIHGFRPDKRVISQIYKVGLPTILLNSITSVTTYCMDLILGTFTSTAVAVYGVYFKLNSFIFMPVFGLNNGIVPIIAYNYGAKKKSRIISTIKTGLTFALVIMTCGCILFECLPSQMLKLFNASDNMLAIGVPAIRIIAPSFLGAAVSICYLSVFQALGSAVYSMIISFVRQIVILLPCAFLLSKTGNVNNVWWSFLIAEIAAVTLAVSFMLHIKKTILDSIPS